jgi:hypothetical protein
MVAPPCCILVAACRCLSRKHADCIAGCAARRIRTCCHHSIIYCSISHVGCRPKATSRPENAYARVLLRHGRRTGLFAD